MSLLAQQIHFSGLPWTQNVLLLVTHGGENEPGPLEVPNVPYKQARSVSNMHENPTPTQEGGAPSLASPPFSRRVSLARVS